MQVQIEISQETKDLFKRLGDKKLIRFNSAFVQIGKKFRKRMKLVFESGATNEAVWQKLSEPYSKWKTRVKGTPFPILNLSGQMGSTFWDDKQSQNVTEIGNIDAKYGSSSALAGWHQTGIKYKDGHILPKREILNQAFIDKLYKQENWGGIIEATLQKIIDRKLGNAKI